MSRRIIGVRRGNSVHERIQRPVQDIPELRLIPTTDVVDKAIILVEDDGAQYRYNFQGSGTDDGVNIIEPTVGAGRWFLMNGMAVAAPGRDTEKYSFVFPAIADATLNQTDWAHEDLDVVGVQVLLKSLPVTAGTYTLQVTGGGNNLLSVASVDLTALGVGSVLDIPLTALTAQLTLNAKDIIEIDVESDDIDLVGSEVHVHLLYETDVFGGGGGGGGVLPPVSNEQYAVLMEDPAGTPVFQCLRQSWVCADFAISSFSVDGGSLIELGDTLLNPTFTASYSLTPIDVDIIDDDGGSSADVSGTPLAFGYTGSYTETVYNSTITWTLTADDGVQADVAQTTKRWVQKVYYGVATDPGGITEAFVKSGLSGGADPLATSRNRSFTVNAGAGEHIWYAYRDPYGDGSFNVGGFDGGFSKVATISVTNDHGVAENYQVWKSDNVNLGSTTVVVT